jgi:hypothetical protein
MRHNTSKFLAGLAVFGVIAAGGSAFTASSGLPQTPKVVGYDTTTITGASANDVSYDMSADGATIDAAVITFVGDQSARTVKAGWDAGDLTTDCTVGAYTAVGDTTVVTCTFVTPVDTKTATTFKVAVT